MIPDFQTLDLGQQFTLVLEHCNRAYYACPAPRHALIGYTVMVANDMDQCCG